MVLARARVAITKLQFCAEKAKRDDLRYFWADTCCIDKSNHAELSREINAIFRRCRWESLYRKMGLVVCGNIARCYVSPLAC